MCKIPGWNSSSIRKQMLYSTYKAAVQRCLQPYISKPVQSCLQTAHSHHDRGGSTSHQLSSDPSRWIRREIEKLQWHSQMKASWLAGEFRMRHTGQTKVFKDSKAHVSCTTPPLKIHSFAMNSVKLKCSNTFIYFTFTRCKSKPDLELTAQVIINHLTWGHNHKFLALKSDCADPYPQESLY